MRNPAQWIEFLVWMLAFAAGMARGSATEGANAGGHAGYGRKKRKGAKRALKGWRILADTRKEPAMNRRETALAVPSIFIFSVPVHP